MSLGRIHHAYLFRHPWRRKTSIARLLAKANCETGITATPCGVCDNCREIEQGRFVDLIEIDAASRTKVEDTRDLLDNVQYAPARGRFKVYLIDEVHMLSRHSFNALLKPLKSRQSTLSFAGDDRSAEIAGDDFVTLSAISSQRRWMSSKSAINLSTSSMKNISLTSRGRCNCWHAPLKAAREMP